MRQNDIKIERLTARQERAAILVAEDKLTDAAISESVRVAPSTLQRWKRLPLFSSRVAQILNAFKKRALKTGLARVDRRLEHLSDGARRLLKVMGDRAADPVLRKFPGGDTGLVILSDLKEVAGKIVPFVKTDVALLTELRGILRDVAEETGDRIQRHEIAAADREPVLARTSDECMGPWIDLGTLTYTELKIMEVIIAAAIARHAAGSGRPAEDDLVTYPSNVAGERLMVKCVALAALPEVSHAPN